MADTSERTAILSHRASYILEFGTWRATCRVCGWAVADPQRRQAAAQFRHHIRNARVIDLRTVTEEEGQPDYLGVISSGNS